MGWEGNALAVAFKIGVIFNPIIITFSYYFTIFTTYRFLVKTQQYIWFFVFIVINILIFSNLMIGGEALMCVILPDLGVTDIPKAAMESGYAKYGYWGSLTSILRMMQMIISYFALLCLPVASKFFRDQLRVQKQQNNLEKENLQLQMDFLKAQIHPHFLFNTLNNIYSLSTHKESGKAAEMISRLASLLQYAIYKGKNEFIGLNNEIEMLKDYINLEAIRSDSLKIKLDFQENMNQSIMLPPFLLLPLVENAFKHGVRSQLDESCIRIKLFITEDYTQLEVINSFNNDYRGKNRGGFGLSNLQKRLNYYYSDTYTLETKENGHLFTAILKIPILCPK